MANEIKNYCEFENKLAALADQYGHGEISRVELDEAIWNLTVPNKLYLKLWLKLNPDNTGVKASIKRSRKRHPNAVRLTFYALMGYNHPDLKDAGVDIGGQK